jgi:hypothetical protein
MLHDSAMTRPNTIIVPGGKMELAMQLIFTPMILRLMDMKRRAVRTNGREAGGSGQGDQDRAWSVWTASLPSPPTRCSCIKRG